MNILRKIQDSLIAGFSPSRDVVYTGGFVSLFSKDEALVWINQTLPIGDCSPEDVQSLLQVHVDRKREPFFEFCEDLWPAIPPLLERNGIVLLKRMPLMALTRDES